MSPVGVAARFGRLLAAEWRKLWSVHAMAAALVAMPPVALLFSWFFSYDAGVGYAALSDADKAAFDPTAISLQSHLVAQLVVGILGVLAVTTEYSSDMIATTAIAVPRRGVLFSAKATVITAVTALVGTVSAFLSFWLGQAVIGARGAPAAALGDPHVARSVIGMGLYLAATALLGLALGTLLRSSAAAIGLIGAAVLIIPALSQNLPAAAAGVIARFWPSLAGSQIMTVVLDPGLLEPWAGFALFLATVAAITVSAWIAFRTRDI